MSMMMIYPVRGPLYTRLSLPQDIAASVCMSMSVLFDIILYACLPFKNF